MTSDEPPSAPALMQEDVVPTICLIGATGTGKSTTGNTLFKRLENDLFQVSDQMTSMTFEPKSDRRPWRGSASHGEVRCVDTPGLGDTAGRDSEHVGRIAQMLKDHVKHVNVFMVFFNSEDRKLNIHLQEMLVTFRDTFGQAFIRHVMICFTHWEYDRKSKLKRKKHGITAETNSRMINDQLKATLGEDCDCPCVFLDNTLNVCSEEELEELYDAELPAVLGEFEAELDKIHKFVLSSEPFFCQDVEAALAATDVLRQAVGAWLQISHLLDCEMLGRRLILSEQDVIYKSWLRWRRRRIFGVLRRQHLRFYTDESCSEAAGPGFIDLTGCICVDRQNILGINFFIIYQPSRVEIWGGDASGRSELTPQEFKVESQKVCKRWVLLVGEATQISESCHRIQKLYEALRSSQSELEYVKSIDRVSNKTMVIPVEWVRQLSAQRQGPEAPKVQYKAPTLKQVEKDLKRDQVMVENVLFNCPRGDDLAISVAKHIVKALGAQAKEDDQAQAKATVLARDVILSCSRTEGGGDTIDAVSLLFGGDLVHLVPDSRAAEPVSVHVFHEKAGLEGELSATGVPEFLGDDSAAALGLDRVRNMELGGEQKLHLTAVNLDKWVRDHEVPVCMRCGVPFSSWLRRHHCRACGALICFSCSRHSVSGMKYEDADAAAGLFISAKAMRVCFLCYQKAVIEDLNVRKEAGHTQSARQLTEEGESLRTNSGDSVEAAVEAGAVDDDFCSEGSPAMLDAVPLSSSTNRAEQDASARLSEEADDTQMNDFPAVSVEMGSRYKVCSQNPTSETDAVLFSLDCRYVRIVRWSGLADSGRIFISIVPK